MDDELSEPIWKLLRGDLSVPDFEAWFYRNETALLPHFGEELHYDLLWLDFKNFPELVRMAPRLEQVVAPYLRCECQRLGQHATFPMGFDRRDERFHATVKELASGGKAMGWLQLGQCSCCGQHWMVACDQTVFDLYLADRLSPEQAEAILNTGQWPVDFSSYERVLKLCKTRAGANAYMGGNSWTTQITTRELKAARPDIENEEIAWLLGVTSQDIANILAEDARVAAAAELEAELERNPPRKSWWQRLIDP